MGGCLASMYAADGPERNNLAGVVLSSPLIEMAAQSKVSKPVITLGSILSKAIPSLPVPVSLDEKFISRNPIEIERYEKDPLIHNFGSLRGLADLINSIRLLSKEKYKKITLPIYICFGTADGINDCDSAKELFSKLPSENKTWREWPGFYHESM
jgi:acylglycerol lipase